jgi:NADH-quinone oxidoreductase subunit H
MYYEFHPWWTVITIAVIMGVLQGTCAYLILLERKVAAWVQDRLGPNRVGPGGLLQPIADGVKMFLKEDIVPSHVDKVFYLLAPAIAIGTATLAFAVVPFGPTDEPPREVRQAPWPQTTAQAKEYHTPEFVEQVQNVNGRYQAVIAPHVDIGILFTFAVSSLAVYGIVLGGWSSNSKYSLIGSLRSSAQIISYEIPMGLSILGVLLLTGSLNLEWVIGQQLAHGWNVFYQPLAFLLFLTSMFAECNRLPFDLPETEQELVGGYHTEYSAMKFGLFFLGEYTHMITTSFMLTVLFFGGWAFPWVAGPDSPWVVKLIVFAVKMFLVILLYMLVRWTLPRFRFDQLMGLAWKGLIPLALVNLLAVMVVAQLAESYGWTAWVKMPVLFVVSVLILFAAGALALGQPRRVGGVSPLMAPPSGG